ncbi:MAG: hypothetical protein MUC97_11575 [Bernardetiaceae bacterium]|jgi:hypothetical protein|nr:hypothetical protein [Bernardetiaceae bacterium]
MKLVDTLIFSTAVALFLIGMHQTFVHSQGIGNGLLHSYWLFMVVAGLLLWFKNRRTQQQKAAQAAHPSPLAGAKPSKPKGKPQSRKK